MNHFFIFTSFEQDSIIFITIFTTTASGQGGSQRRRQTTVTRRRAAAEGQTGTTNSHGTPEEGGRGDRERARQDDCDCERQEWSGIRVRDRGDRPGGSIYMATGEAASWAGLPAACLTSRWRHRAAHRAASFIRPCPCRAAGLGGGLGTSWSFGPGRLGPDGHRAGPCLGRAKLPGHGPGHEPAGCMARYTYRLSYVELAS